MIATDSLRVEIEAPIQSDSELHSLVAEATDYLNEDIERGPVKRAADQMIRWNLVKSLAGSTFLKVDFFERDKYGERSFESKYSVKDFRDPVFRRVAMIRLHRALLQERSKKISQSIESGIRELEREESND